jgi:methyl coenzyme M reductase subunit C
LDLLYVVTLLISVVVMYASPAMPSSAMKLASPMMSVPPRRYSELTMVTVAVVTVGIMSIGVTVVRGFIITTVEFFVTFFTISTPGAGLPSTGNVRQTIQIL